MADESEHQHSEPEPPRQRGGMLSIVKALAFVSVIVVVEIVAASILVPSAEETERLGEQLTAAANGETIDSHDAHAAQHDSGEANHKHSDDVREVPLGNYNITRFNPTSHTTLAIDFELYGTVLAKDAGEFQHLYDNSKARIREQITMTLHASESADLADSGLGLIKRRILEKTNRALGQPMLKEVLFSKFSFVER